MDAKKRYFCSLPETPERQYDVGLDPERLALLRAIDRKWVNGTVLRYSYFDDHPDWKGTPEQKGVVRRAFATWEDVGIGLSFREVSNVEDAEVRIGFQQNGRSWSGLGRDILQFTPTARTMNLGWDVTVQGPNGLDTVVHEIGHTLGFPHEHQNPNAGIEWNAGAAYEEFGGPPNNWPPEVVDWNVLRKLSRSEFEGSSWDKDSIMHYSFPAGIIQRPEKYQREPLDPSPGLSQKDKEEVQKFYPSIGETDYQVLEPLQLQQLDIEAGEQLNFVIKPGVSRDYEIRTFGASDTVMVLFEGRDDPRFVAGADDTGTDLNASLAQRLVRGREYVLRLRLYWKTQSGRTALMMW